MSYVPHPENLDEWLVAVIDANTDTSATIENAGFEEPAQGWSPASTSNQQKHIVMECGCLQCQRVVEAWLRSPDTTQADGGRYLEQQDPPGLGDSYSFLNPDLDCLEDNADLEQAWMDDAALGDTYSGHNLEDNAGFTEPFFIPDTIGSDWHPMTDDQDSSALVGGDGQVRTPSGAVNKISWLLTRPISLTQSSSARSRRSPSRSSESGAQGLLSRTQHRKALIAPPSSVVRTAACVASKRKALIELSSRDVRMTRGASKHWRRIGADLINELLLKTHPTDYPAASKLSGDDCIISLKPEAAKDDSKSMKIGDFEDVDIATYLRRGGQMSDLVSFILPDRPPRRPRSRTKASDMDLTR